MDNAPPIMGTLSEVIRSAIIRSDLNRIGVIMAVINDPPTATDMYSGGSKPFAVPSWAMMNPNSPSGVNNIPDRTAVRPS